MVRKTKFEEVQYCNILYFLSILSRGVARKFSVVREIGPPSPPFPLTTRLILRIKEFIDSDVFKEGIRTQI